MKITLKNQDYPELNDPKPSHFNNEDVVFPTRTFSHRFCTYLVLFSFFFQTIWPSVVLAQYNGQDIWKDHDGITLKVSPAIHKISGQKGIHIRFYDERESDGSSDPDEDFALTPRTVTSIVDREIFGQPDDEIGNKKSLYSFDHQGITFHIDLSGNVMMLPSAGSKESCINPLRVKTDGFVALDNTLAIKHLKVKAQQFFGRGDEGSSSSLVDRIDLWTKRSGTDLDKGPGAVLMRGVKWNVHSLFMHQGSLENWGNLSIAPGGTVNLSHQNVSNHNLITLGAGAKITHAYTIGNYGAISGDSYGLDCLLLHNDSGASIKGDRVSVLVQDALTNNGHIQTTTESNIVVFGGVRNLGVITSEGKQFISIDGNFYNRGTVWAQDQTLNVRGTTLNEGKIKGKDLYLDLAILDNQSLIESADFLEMKVKGGVNAGLIRSKGATHLGLFGDFANERLIQSRQNMDVHVQQGFTLQNKGQLKSTGDMAVYGTGTVQNHGIITSETKTDLNVGTFHNHHLVSAARKLTLGVRGLLHNHATGLLGSNGQTVIEGSGEFINEGAPVDSEDDDDAETKPLGLVSIGSVVFRHFEGTFQNKGYFYTKQKIIGQARQFHNSGTVQAVEGYEGLQIADYLNTGSWLGNGSLVVTRGKNAGLVSAEKLSIDVREAFTQEAIGATKATGSLEVTGAGTFTNKGLIHTPLLTLGVRTVDNQHRILGERISVLNSVQSLTNAKDALIDVQDVEFVTGGSARVVNKGNWSMSRSLKGTVRSFENSGKVLLEGNAVNAFTILQGLTTTEGSLWEASSLTLDVQGEWLHEGTLCLRGASALRVHLLKNFGKIGRAEGTYGLLEVAVNELQNRGSLGFYHLNLTVRDRLTTTSTSVISAAERLIVDYDKAYDHYGTLSAKDLTYRGTTAGAKLTNKGIIKATEKSLIRAEFKNTLGDPETVSADLTGLTLEHLGYFETDHLYLEGHLTLRNVKSLGNGLRDLLIHHAAEVKFLNCGYGVVTDKNKLLGRGLAFKKITNYGKIGFGGGTYHVEGEFINHGTQVAMAGQDLWCGDLDNQGIIAAPIGLRVDQTRGTFKRLGKVQTDKELTLQLGPQIDAPTYLLDNAPHWKIKEALRVEANQFVNTQPLGLAFPVYFTIRDEFHNKSNLHSPEMHIKAGSFKQGWRESVYDDWSGGTVRDHLADLKSGGDLTIETESDLDNQFGHIKSVGNATLTARNGNILNGQSIPSHYPYNVTNGASISADKKLTLKGRDILNVFGVLAGYEGVDFTWRNRLLNYSGIIKIQGSGVFRGNLLHNQRSVPAGMSTNTSYGDSGCGGSFRANWLQSSGDAAQLLGTGNLYFYVTNLTNEASHITCFGLIRDRDRIERTRSNLGYFQHIDRESILNGPVSDMFEYFARHSTAGERGSFSSATEVDLRGFSEYQIIGARMSGGRIGLQGDRLLMTDNGATYGGRGSVPYPLTTRISLLPAMQRLAGGDLLPRTQAENPVAVFSAQTGPTALSSSLPPITIVNPRAVVQKIAHSLASGADATQKRLMMDWVSTLFSLQSTLCMNWGRGYINAGQSAQSHLVALLQNARDEATLRRQATLTRSQAEEAQKPLLTFEEEDVVVDPQGTVVNGWVPYLTFPRKFQNLHLLGGGATLDSDSTMFVRMNHDITTQSSTVHSVGDIDFFSKGTRVSQTLKDTSVIECGDQTITRDTARQQDRMISDTGSIRDQSHGDFLSQGAARRAPLGAITMGSTHGNTTRIPLELFETCETRIKKRTIFGGTDRTIKETKCSAVVDSAVAGIDLTITSGLEPGQRIHEVGTQDRAGGNITYVGYDLFKQGLIQVNSVHTEARGVFRSTDSHQERALKTPTSSVAGGDIILDVINRVDASGWMVSAVNFDDYARESNYGALIKELTQMRRVAGFKRAGYKDTTNTLEHDTMIPTVFQLDGQFRAYARTEADREGYVLWQGVVANIRGGYCIERRLIEKAVTLKSTRTQTSTSVGLTGSGADAFGDLADGQNPLDGLVHNFVDTTTFGKAKGYGQAEDDQDRAVAALRTVNAAFQDVRDIQTILNDKDQALKTLLSRIASVGVAFGVSDSTTTQKTQIPTVVTMQGDAEVLGPEWRHDEGAQLRTTKRVIAPNLRYFSMSPAVQSIDHSASSTNVGVSYNFLTRSVSFNADFQEDTYQHIEHNAAGIEADKIFLRSEVIENTGGHGKARIVDIGVQEDARFETPVDTETTKRKSLHVDGGMSQDQKGWKTQGGNLKFENTKVEKRRLAAQKSGFTATQQFYYTVGGVSHEISADMGLRPDEQTQALSFKTQRGETFYHRPIPMEAADSTLYALFSATPDMMVNPRAKVIIKITEALSRPEIRDRVGGEALILLQSTLQMNSSSLKPPKRTVSQQAFDDNHLDKPRGPRHGDAPDQPPHVQTPLEKAQQKAYEVYRTNSGYLGISRDPIQDRHGNQYVRVNINPDGDCCFHALGIRRADFLDRIEAYIDECEEALSNPGMGVRVQTGIQVRNLCNPLLTTAKDQEEAAFKRHDLAAWQRTLLHGIRANLDGAQLQAFNAAFRYLIAQKTAPAVNWAIVLERSEAIKSLVYEATANLEELIHYKEFVGKCGADLWKRIGDDDTLARIEAHLTTLGVLNQRGDRLRNVTDADLETIRGMGPKEKTYIQHKIEFEGASAARKQEILNNFYAAHLNREWLDPSAIMHLGERLGFNVKAFKRDARTGRVRLDAQTPNADSEDVPCRLIMHVNGNHYDVLYPMDDAPEQGDPAQPIVPPVAEKASAQKAKKKGLSVRFAEQVEEQAIDKSKSVKACNFEERKGANPSLHDLPGALEQQQRLRPLYQQLIAAVTTYNQTHNALRPWLTADEIVKKVTRIPNPAVEPVRQALSAYEAVLADAMNWATRSETCEAFLKNYVVHKGYGVFPRPLSERVYKDEKGLLDAIGILYNLDIAVYAPVSDSTAPGSGIDVIHQTAPLVSLSGAPEPVRTPINLLLIAEQDQRGVLRPHMDRLEQDLESIQAGQRIIETKPEDGKEVTNKSGVKINAPIGEIMALIDNVKYLKAQMMQDLQDEGVPTPQAEEQVREEIMPIVEDIQKTDKALAAAEAKAVERVKERQKALGKESGQPSSDRGVSLASDLYRDNTHNDLSNPIYDDIARDLRAEKIQILESKLAALDQHAPAEGLASRVTNYLRESLNEQVAAVRADPWGSAWGAIRGAAEFIPGGIGTAAYAGNASSDIYDGTKTVGEVAFEASVAWFTGKAGILACRGIKAGAKMAYRKGAPLFESVAEKMSKRSHPAPTAKRGVDLEDWTPPKAAKDKVPDFLGDGRPNQTGVGVRWVNKHGKDGVRIDKGDPTMPYAHQRVDHVRITKDGKAIGLDGKPIPPTPSAPKPSQTEEAHIPLSDWVQWSDWYKP